MSSRCLQDVFSVTILRLPRRLEDVLQRHLKNVLKTLSRRLGRRKNVTLKTSWRHLEDMSWRCLEGIIETNKILGISVSNKSIFHKSISDNSKANPKCINQNPIISLLVLFWNSGSISVLRIKISNDRFGVMKSA